MKRLISLLVAITLFSIKAVTAPPGKYNILIAPGTLTENSVTILWDKQYSTETITGVRSASGAKPEYVVTNGTEIIY